MTMGNAARADLHCPVCLGESLDVLYPEYEGSCITSDYAVLPNAAIANRCCRGCGLIFNARGTRGDTAAFYRESYNLMMRRESAAIQSFSGPQPMSQAEKSLRVLIELASIPARGRVLEIGAGKGEFLTYFLAERGDWDVVAVEPSAAAQVLRSTLGRAEVIHGEYMDYVAAPGSFDLVVALGVLEHVENPLELLRKAHDALRPDGVLYLRVPNFARNPNDLFCADHLSKLTVHSLRGLGNAAGFKIEGEREEGVPVFVALRKCAGDLLGPVANAYRDNVELAQANVAVARAGVDAVMEARARARSLSQPFAIFGLGASGLFAPLQSGFSPSDIAAYIDENKTIWGTEVHGRPVGGLNLIPEIGIKHIALAVSPVYIPKIRDKLAPYGVSVYAGA
jgi:SAM-dependent methyltransferase